MFALANVLIHELNHVIWLATFEVPAGTITEGLEPFHRDERICELGSSWENFMYGGLPYPMGENTTQRPIKDLATARAAGEDLSGGGSSVR